MCIAVEIDLSALSDLEARARRVPPALEAGARAGGELIQGEVAAAAHVESGGNRASIEREGLTVQPITDGAEAVIVSKMPYDKYEAARGGEHDHYTRGLTAVEPHLRDTVQSAIDKALGL